MTSLYNVFHNHSTKCNYQFLFSLLTLTLDWGGKQLHFCFGDEYLPMKFVLYRSTVDVIISGSTCLQTVDNGFHFTNTSLIVFNLVG
jgi:hypothetical protein